MKQPDQLINLFIGTKNFLPDTVVRNLQHSMDIALAEKVELALDSIRPYLIADGGNVKFLDVTEEGVARVELMGACGTCPMSSMTLKAGVEEAIRSAVPGITRVEAVRNDLDLVS